MAVSRRFVGWDRPIVDAVCDTMTEDWSPDSGPLDLSDRLVVVPTAHSGRRLREQLALYAQRAGTGVLPGRVFTPDASLRMLTEAGEYPIATPTEALAVWMHVLKTKPLEEYAALFPAKPADDPDSGWVRTTAVRLQCLRRDITESGFTCADVSRHAANETTGVLANDSDRWRALAELEGAYLNRLAVLGLADADSVRIDRVHHCSDDACDFSSVLVCCVPDPIPLALVWLQRLAEKIPVTVLIHAPETMKAAFDDWGRPVVEYWETTDLHLPECGNGIKLVSRPQDQARAVTQYVAESGVVPGDFAAGVMDSEVTACLERDFASAGLRTFNPAGESLQNHRVTKLVDYLLDLVETKGDYAAVSHMMRHPDFLVYACGGGDTAAVLEELDVFQNRHLPVDLDALESLLSTASASLENLKPAVACLCGIHQDLMRDPVAAVTDILSRLYAGVTVDSATERGRRIIAAVDAVRAVSEEVQSSKLQELELTGGEKAGLFRFALRRAAFFPERSVDSIDLEGWLELPWDNAPHMVLTAMNDGAVPEAVVGDAFLPDSARTELGLKNNRQRFARDVFLLAGILESRRNDAGGVLLILGKVTNSGDRLRPSRLFFQCPDSELPSRARYLFGEAVEGRDRIAQTVSWRLKPVLPQAKLRTMSVTAFKVFLDCPFRFYLQYVLKMEPVDDRKQELDALDFGNICHHALKEFGRDTAIRDSADSKAITDYLCGCAEAYVSTVYGRRPGLPVLVQLETAKQRLRAAAEVQAEQVQAGWHICGAEEVLGSASGGATWNGITVTGRIDRIERHENGRYRLLDYKTSDNAIHPEKDHLRNARENTASYRHVVCGSAKNREWTNLQLPLYAGLSGFASPEDSICGYFSLPKAVSETDIIHWDTLNGHLIESALRCAEAITGEAAELRFWPPTEKVTYDNFESILFSDPARYVDGSVFERKHPDSLR